MLSFTRTIVALALIAVLSPASANARENPEPTHKNVRYDKASIRKNPVVRNYLALGVSVAAYNHPFLKDASYTQILRHCARSPFSSFDRRASSGTSTRNESARSGNRLEP